MSNESGFVCVVADYDMVDKITKISDVVYRLVQKAVTENNQGKFNSIGTRKRRFFKDQEITFFDDEKFKSLYPALFQPVRFCYVYHDEFSGTFMDYSDNHILETGNYLALMEIRLLITNPMCTLYLTPSQASLWKKIQAADINLYLEAVK